MKTRTVLILGAVGAVVLGLGLSYRLQGTGVTRQQMEIGRLAVPDLAARLQTADRVEIVRGDKTLSIQKSGDRWVLPERGGYRVQTDKLRGMLTGLTELRLLDPRTNDPGQYSRLGVDDPTSSRGTAILVRVLDGAEKPITEMILGHRRVRTQGNVPEQIYIRFPGQTQAWLAEGRLAVDSDVQLWLDRDVANVPAAKIADVVVERGTERLEFTRQSGQPSLKTPAEHPELDPYRVEDVFRAFESLTFTDVQPESKMPGASIGSSRFTTADGLRIEVKGNRAGDQFWVRLAASGTGAAPFEARWAGWAFQLGQWKEKSLLPRMEDLAKAAPPALPAPALPAPAPPTPVLLPPTPDVVSAPATAPTNAPDAGSTPGPAQAAPPEAGTPQTSPAAPPAR